jgi:F0F1-type ATP synthase membrane subunit c/vacuolar-type H+-ATPase subunit K
VLTAVIFTPAGLFSGAGGFAAAIAIGAFVGQALDAVRPRSDLRRRRFIAAGGLIGFVGMIGLLLLSVKWR